MPLNDYPGAGAMGRGAFRQIPGQPQTPVYPAAPSPAAMPPPVHIPIDGRGLTPNFPGRYSPLQDLRAALEEELRGFTRRVKWWALGAGATVVPANGGIDIPIQVDDAAFYVGLEFDWKVSANPQDITVQFVEASGYQIGRAPVALTCLTDTPTTTNGRARLPEEWVLSPGETAYIRLLNRSGTNRTVHAFINGYKIYPDAFFEAARPSGVGDYYVTDAGGGVHVYEGALARPYPGAAVAGGRPVPWDTAPLQKTIAARSVLSYAQQARDRDELVAVLEGWRLTFKPVFLGKDAISVAAGVGTQGTVTLQTSADSYHVFHDLVIGFDAALSADWTLQVIENAGGQYLFYAPMHVDLLRESGCVNGGRYRLPQRYAARPNAEIRLLFTNASAGSAIAADVHFAGRRIADAARG